MKKNYVYIRFTSSSCAFSTGKAGCNSSSTCFSVHLSRPNPAHFSCLCWFHCQLIAHISSISPLAWLSLLYYVSWYDHNIWTTFFFISFFFFQFQLIYCFFVFFFVLEFGLFFWITTSRPLGLSAPVFLFMFMPGTCIKKKGL